jgi:hypothetical protein
MAATLAPPKLMTGPEAAWVREYVFTSKMRAEYNFQPRRFTGCPCEQPAFVVCENGNHDRCPRKLEPSPETYLYRPQDLEETTGIRYVQVVPVWRVGRPCRPRCGCGCHSGKPKPTLPAASSTPPVSIAWPSKPRPAKAGKGEQLGLF